MSDTAGQVSDETLAELRLLAAEATPGPWRDNVLGSEGYQILGGHKPVGVHGSTRPLYIARCGHEAWEVDKANAAYIAAADPPTVLALLDTVDALRAETERQDAVIQDRFAAVRAIRAERDAACEQLARVEALHVPYAPRPYGTAPPLKYTCQHDRMPWPCRTIAALTDTAEEASE